MPGYDKHRGYKNTANVLKKCIGVTNGVTYGVTKQ